MKSSTSAKPVHVPDLAIQVWVVRGSGQHVGRATLMHIDRDCVYPHLERLFAEEDMTERVETAQADMPALVAKLQAVVGGDAAPDVDIGPHCSTPYDCDYAAHCHAERGVPVPSVLDVCSLSSKDRWALYGRGILSAGQLLSELEAGTFAPKQAARRSIESLATGEAFVDAAALRAALASWEDPLLFLDFETEGLAVPRLPGTRPYQQVPFQFSAHLRAKRSAPLEHHEYLHTDADDPRPVLSASLAELAHGTFGRTLDGPGSVVAYNAAFERRCLDTLASTCVEHAAPLLDLACRLVDPWPILKDAVYHPEFRTSYSLKAVAPALLGTDSGYSELDVASGTAAQVAYAELLASSCSPDRHRELAEALRAYCAQDTLVLARLVEWMEAQAGLPA